MHVTHKVSDETVLDLSDEVSTCHFVTCDEMDDDSLLFSEGEDKPCSPHKENFLSLEKLAWPVTLQGVTGEVTCEHGGTIKIQTLDTQGEIVTIETAGHFNPDQSVCIFSSHAHFWHPPWKAGHMLVSWTKSFLHSPRIGRHSSDN